MKKFISLLLTCIICLGFSACSTSSKDESSKKMTITVTDREGNVSEMTVNELKSTTKNEAQFNTLYNYAKATFTGTVQEIKTNFTINNSTTVYDSIQFKEGITLYTDHNVNSTMAILEPEGIYDYSKINIGDKLTVENGIIRNMYGSVNIFTCEKLSKSE